jgi:hypothetical protein
VREIERQKERETERERQRERDRERQRDRDRETESDREQETDLHSSKEDLKVCGRLRGVSQVMFERRADLEDDRMAKSLGITF